MQLAAHQDVLWVEKYHRPTPANAFTPSVVQSGQPSPAPANEPFFAAGIRGNLSIVGVADTGVTTAHRFFRDEQCPSAFDSFQPSCRVVVCYNTTYGDNLDVSKGHGTHVAGTLLGQNIDGPSDFDGTCPECKLYFHDVQRGTGGLNVPFDIGSGIFNPVYDSSPHARIHSDSWGGTSNGYTTFDAVVDEYIWIKKDFNVLIAAGNDGYLGLNTVGTPGTAKNVLSLRTLKI